MFKAIKTIIGALKGAVLGGMIGGIYSLSDLSEDKKQKAVEKLASDISYINKNKLSFKEIKDILHKDFMRFWSD